MKNDGHDTSTDDRALLALADKLETFAETLSPAERQFVRDLIDRSLDPIERVTRRRGDALLDADELEFLAGLEAAR